eukprot:TRINITY_DN3257_c0_g1_i1.p1 TRINITY_DN3257_c0_g1~~TRINITY_DN3257_c0_g1_i1.p1  ORF type:complete len:553 (+),score=190.56 TRINITY_DN3257_c0_g1_i1:98-1756(+)
MSFAGSVMLGDLDDFITPAQDCVAPIMPNSGSDSGTAHITIESDISAPVGYAEPDLINSSQAKTASVSLDDCLACSGCVTSAEAVLIQEQSSKQLFDSVKDEKFALKVVSISAQTIASVAYHFDISLTAAFSKMKQWLHSIGVDCVIDTGVANDISLLETEAEFRVRLKNTSGKSKWEAPECTRAFSSTQTLHINDDGSMGKEVEDKPTYDALPMIVGACPGWVCYAEKTHPQVIRHLSTAKSAQQITGTLIKSVYAPLININGNEVFHAAIMPCFDKKLEGSRKDFYDGENKCADVDCVLATAEIIEYLTEFETSSKLNLSLAPLADIEIESVADVSSLSQYLEKLLTNFQWVDEEAKMVISSGALATSGGYLEEVMRNVAPSVTGCDELEKVELTRVRPKNPDMKHIKIEGSEGSMTACTAYGFRNIQTVVRRLKRRNASWQFVEIMACPSGCLNGGGQAKLTSPKPSEAEKSETTETTETTEIRQMSLDDLFEKYHSESIIRSPHKNLAVMKIYEQIKSHTFEDEAMKLFHTRYHAVKSLEATGLSIKW